MPAAVRHVRDRLLASDPELARARSGVRALLAALLSSALLLGAARWLGLASELPLVGIIVSVMAAVGPQDRPRREQAFTLVGIAAVASGVVVLGAVVGDHPLLSALCFLATIYAAFQARRFGPRGTAIGTIAYQAYFYAMLLHPDPQSWGWIVVAVVAGSAVAALVRLAMVRRHPHRVLRRELRAWRAALVLMLSDLARSLQPDAGAAQRRRCDADLARLLDQSLAIETQLARRAADDPQGAELRDRLLRYELAAEALVDGVAAARCRGAAAREGLAGVLRELAASLRGDAKPAVPAWSEQAGSALESLPGLRWSCGDAVARLSVQPPWAAPLPALRGAPAAPAASEPLARRGRGLFSLDDLTRRAVQACVAAAGALVAGRLISPEHWYWAVFAAFVLFTQASTREQAVSRAWQRTLANVAGLALGLAVAELVQGRPVLQVGLLFAFIGIGFYGFRDLPVLYGAVLTAMLAMLYELLGMYGPGVLMLRLAETLAGAAIAALSSAVVLPVRMRDESDAQSVQVLRTAADVMRRGFGTEHPPPAREVLRRLDGDLQALRAALGPVTSSSYPARNSRHRRRLQRLSRLVYCVRHLYALGLEERVVASALRMPVIALAAELDAAAAQLDAVQAAQRALGVDARGAQGSAPGAPSRPRIGDTRGDPEPVQLAKQWLREADAITRALRPRDRDLPRLQPQGA